MNPLNVGLKTASVIVFLALTACSTMTPPRYSVNADTNVLLRDMMDTSVSVTSYVQKSEFDANCRLMGTIEASDGRGVTEFIRDSFNDELKFAGIYGGDGAANKLEVAVDRVAFSSTEGLTNGWWEFDITLSNIATRRSIRASTHYAFKSGFDAITACNQTADALTPAVQELILDAVSNENFRNLISTN